MKKFLFAVAAVGLIGLINCANALEYGDLHDIKWCPCNPDEQYDNNGSVVQGRTVMCPCNSMYEGYNRSFEKDVRKVKEKIDHTYEKIASYKYYVGFEYNKSQVEANNKKMQFNDAIFPDTDGIKIPSGQIVDHQDNIGVVLGFRPHKNFGFEAFYNRAYNSNKVSHYDGTSLGNPSYHMVDTFTTKYQAYGVDLVGYLPITRYFDFVAFVGVGKYKFDNSARFEVMYGEAPSIYTKSISFDEDEIGYRAGGGVQFNIVDGVALRLMYKYINVGSATIHYLQEYSVGLRFLF